MSLILEKLVIQVGTLLNAEQLKLITAESCTGGGLGYWLTNVPGNSSWYEGGFITYSNAAKSQMLRIDPAIIITHGAVSSETACAMAEGALQHSQANISIAITGIAGPEGGSADKPVGTVWFAWAKKGLATKAEEQLFKGNRQEVREQAIAFALQGIFCYK